MPISLVCGGLEVDLFAGGREVIGTSLGTQSPFFETKALRRPLQSLIDSSAATATERQQQHQREGEGVLMDVPGHTC